MRIGTAAVDILVAVSSVAKQATASRTSPMPARMRSDSMSRVLFCATVAPLFNAVTGLRSLDTVLQQLPDGREFSRQPGQLAQIAMAFVRAVEVAAARGGEVEFQRLVGVFDVLGG